MSVAQTIWAVVIAVVVLALTWGSWSPLQFFTGLTDKAKPVACCAVTAPPAQSQGAPIIVPAPPVHVHVHLEKE